MVRVEVLMMVGEGRAVDVSVGRNEACLRMKGEREVWR